MKFIANIISNWWKTFLQHIFILNLLHFEKQILHKILELRYDKNTSQIYDLKPIIRLPLFAIYRAPF